MSERILVIHMEPMPKERPRATVVGGHARIYTPRKTAEYEKHIADSWKTIHEGGPETGPVSVRIAFVMPIPKSATRRAKLDMENRRVRPVTKPDADNLAKAVLDGLNGVAYKDDNQIVDLSVSKFYGPVPKVMIRVKSWEPQEAEPAT